MECATGTPRRKHELSSMSSILNLQKKYKRIEIQSALECLGRIFRGELD